MAYIRRSPLTREIIDKLALVAESGPFAEETADSRIGIQSGLLGGGNVTRKWRVYCESPGDNPITVMEGLSAQNGGERVGTTFPTTGGWGDGSFVLLHFTIIDHWVGTTVWTLLGTYVPSYVTALQFGEQWSFKIRSSLESERVFVDMDGKGIGTPVYVKKQPNANAVPFTALNPTGVSQTIYLADGSAEATNPLLARYMSGADIPLRTSTLVLSKTIPSFLPYLEAVQNCVNLKKNVNNDAFSTNTTSGMIAWINPAPAPGEGTVLFSDIDVDEIPNPAGGPIPSCRITMTFKINPDGWKETKYHTFKFDDGTEAPITYASGPLAGQQVKETFRVNGETNLSDLVNAFETGSV